MWKNYLLVAVRNLARQGMYTIVNITGLAVGIACCLLILIYLQYELSFDRFHKDATEIFRVMVKNPSQFFEGQYVEATPPPLAEAMKSDFSEVKAATRFGADRVGFNYQGRLFDRIPVLWVESTFTDIFCFAVYEGDIHHALSQPFSMAITRSAAKKIFGTEEAIGKSLRLGSVFDLQVNAVLENIPETSHLQFDFLIAMATRRKYWNEDLVRNSMSVGKSPWQWLSGETYFKLTSGTDVGDFEQRLNSWVANHMSAEFTWEMKLQPLTEIHLKGNLASQISGHGDIRFAYLLSGIALVILFIACFNYMNLSTARSSTRAREVGLRKILGGTRFALVWQFLGESILLTAAAIGAAVLLAELGLPVFNSLVELDLKLDLWNDRFIQISLVGIAVIVGLGAGIYPALFLSSMHARNTIRGLTTVSPRGSALLRNMLVVFQNVISITLIICTMVIYYQVSYMRHRDMGLNPDRMLTIPIRDFRLKKDFRSLGQEIAAFPGVKGVAWSTSFPFMGFGGASAVWWAEKTESEQSPFFHTLEVSDNFLNLYEIQLAEGRGLSDIMTNDDIREAYLINETARKALGWTSAVGKEFGISKNHRGVIVGVVRDFHYSPVRTEVGPLAISLATSFEHALSVKLTGEDDAGVIERVRSIWKDYCDSPLEFEFLSDRIAKTYESENRLITLLTYGSSLAIFVACLGLFGLVSFGVERRMREIAIRKVVGARISEIFGLLSTDFSRWVLVANLMAWPIAYYAMSRWLQGYTYRISLSFWIFAGAGVAAMVVAFLTIGYQAIQAARADPIKSLRYE